MIQTNEVGVGFLTKSDFGGINLKSGDVIPIFSAASKTAVYDHPIKSRLSTFDGSIVGINGIFEGEYSELKVEVVIEHNGKSLTYEVGNVFGDVLVSKVPHMKIPLKSGAKYYVKVFGKNNGETVEPEPVAKETDGEEEKPKAKTTKAKKTAKAEVKFSCVIEVVLFNHEVRL